eukprot:SAG11_NODE_278_length_11284_cov_202.732231_12_plen_74_part_00
MIIKRRTRKEYLIWIVPLAKSDSCLPAYNYEVLGQVRGTREVPLGVANMERTGIKTDKITTTKYLSVGYLPNR